MTYSKRKLEILINGGPWVAITMLLNGSYPSLGSLLLFFGSTVWFAALLGYRHCNFEAHMEREWELLIPEAPPAKPEYRCGLNSLRLMSGPQTGGLQQLFGFWHAYMSSRLFALGTDPHAHLDPLEGLLKNVP